MRKDFMNLLKLIIRNFFLIILLLPDTKFAYYSRLFK